MRRMFVGVFLLSFSFLATSCDNAEPEEQNEPPDFTLQDTNGEDWQLSNHRGKVVMLYFFQPDFLPVGVFQVDELNKVVDRYGADDNVELVAVAFDWDSQDEIDEFITDHDLRMKVLIDNATVFRSLDISTQFYVTLFVNKSGYFHKRTNELLNSEQANSLIADLLEMDA